MYYLAWMKYIDDKYFKTDSKQVVDMLFDAKVFKETLTRDDMVATEEYIHFLLSSRMNSYLRMMNLSTRIDSHNQATKEK